MVLPRPDMKEYFWWEQLIAHKSLMMQLDAGFKEDYTYHFRISQEEVIS
jgi:hypothetical protein